MWNQDELWRDATTKLLYPAFSETPPRMITQQSFDTNGDDSFLERLCHLGRNMPTNRDLCDYGEALQYRPIQQELFDYAFPICLKVWRHDLMSDKETEYGGFCERFLTAWKRSVMQKSFLSAAQIKATENFLCAVAMECMQEVVSPYTKAHHPWEKWNFAIGVYALMFPSLEKLWRCWWCAPQPGAIFTRLRIMAALMYKTEHNPTYENPHLCEDYVDDILLWQAGGHFLPDGEALPLEENLRFLQQRQTPEYFHQQMTELAALPGEHQLLVQMMLAEFTDHEALLRWRLAAQSQFIRKESCYTDCPKWDGPES